MTQAELEELRLRAVAATAHASCPGSGFSVGAAVRSGSGTVHTGVNVETGPATTQSICAETNAINTMLGIEGPDARAVAVAVAANARVAPPCGTCRQHLHRYAPGARITFPGADRPLTISDLLPHPPQLEAGPIRSPRGDLGRRAREAAARAYVPFSGIRVGAALQSARGTVYTGCAVESAAYGRNSICAELNALHAARVAEGEDLSVVRLALAGSGTTVTPCGTCRQSLIELAAGAEITCLNGAGEITLPVSGLLPIHFELHPTP